MPCSVLVPSRWSFEKTIIYPIKFMVDRGLGLSRILHNLKSVRYCVVSFFVCCSFFFFSSWYSAALIRTKYAKMRNTSLTSQVKDAKKILHANAMIDGRWSWLQKIQFECKFRNSTVVYHLIIVEFFRLIYIYIYINHTYAMHFPYKIR